MKKKPKMSEDRPLDALFPELTGKKPLAPTQAEVPSQLEALHPGVLDVELDDGWQWSMALWRDEAGVKGKIERLVQAVVLQHLSQPLANVPRRLGFDLFCFDKARPQTVEFLEAFGFRKMPFLHAQDREAYSARLESWQSTAGKALMPLAVWQLSFKRPNEVLEGILGRVERRLADQFGGVPWGGQPGHMSHVLVEQVAGQMQNITPAPTWGTLQAMDMALVSREPGALRWMSPAVFQALCDFIGVVWTAQRGWDVQWSEPQKAPGGTYLPPVFQIPGGRQVAIGKMLCDVCVMPILSQDEPLWLRQWAQDV